MSPNSYHRRIVTDREALSESYVPTIILARDSQIRELTTCLSPALEHKKPIHAWLYGPPGSGKTCVARYVLSQINQHHTLRHAYINCWNYPTLYSILDKVAQEIRLLGPEIQSTAVKLDKFRKAVGAKPFILVLDEIDKVLPKERNAILYSLSGIPGLGLICIAGNRQSFCILEDRVKSRFNPKLIEFKPYSDKELTVICSLRGELALEAEACSQGTLKEISRLAEGDARCAIQTLNIACQYAEREGSRLLVHTHVKQGWSRACELKAVYTLGALSDHHKLLYELVKGKTDLLSGDLWRLYLETCRARGMKPIAMRTFSVYMNRLIREGLVTGKRAPIRGKVRIFKIRK
ncbi:MAG: AAA family ATPase [Chloroflexi bacterium]|nr:AAA family ATPase [Chloroflexota bacterium]